MDRDCSCDCGHCGCAIAADAGALSTVAENGIAPIASAAVAVRFAVVRPAAADPDVDGTASDAAAVVR